MAGCLGPRLRLLQEFEGAEEGDRGALGYNCSYKDLGEFWSLSGLFAITGRDSAQIGYRGSSEDLIKPLLDTL